MQSRFEIRPIVLILFVLAFAFGSIACGSPSEKSTTTGNPTNITPASPSPASSASATTADNRGMSHGGIMASSPDAASAPYDLQFIDTMSVHHGNAVDMAKLAAAKAQHPELKALAKKIVDDQEKEIGQMKSWRDGWYAGKSQAVNLELPGMMHSMKGMNMDGLNAATGAAFDLMFLNMMTQHHQGAVAMAKEALLKAEHAEIKQLARRISDAQQQEIAQMNRWRKVWDGAK